MSTLNIDISHKYFNNIELPYNFKNILFNLFVLKTFAFNLYEFYDLLFPLDILFIIINYQLFDFVCIKGINRLYFEEEIKTWVSYYKKSKHKSILKKLPLDIYSKEDYIYKEKFDQLFGYGLCKNIVNIMRQGRKPNSKNYKRIFVEMEHIHHPKNSNFHIVLFDVACFPLKIDQEVAVVSNEFYDKKYRVLAKAIMSIDVDVKDKNQNVIIEIKETWSPVYHLQCFVVLDKRLIAIKRSDYKKNCKILNK